MFKSIQIEVGLKVEHQSEAYEVTRVLDAITVLAVNEKTKRLQKLPIALLTLFEEQEAPKVVEERVWDALSEKEQQIAEERYDAIEPLLGEFSGDGNKAKEIAAKQKVHISTIYKWINKYETTGLVSSLADEEGRGGKGKSRLNPEVDKIISETISDVYFKQDLNQEETCAAVIQVCKNANLPVPSKNTIRNRIAQLTDYERLKGKKGKYAADQAYGATEGHLEAKYPFDIVQIDHSLLNVKLVDEVFRRPLGRPWLTLAFDLFSRFPMGIYISLDTPGNTGTGLCLAHAMFPKEAYLTSLELKGEWPCWGPIKNIHADNAKEFRGRMLEMAAKEHGSKLIFRKVKTPNYGGHIERMMGTFKKDIQTLPGKTFINKEDKKSYDSDGMACITLFELEQWLVTYIIKVYANKYHQGIKNSPYKKLMEGIFGGGGSKPIGLPPRPLDESRLKLDFMPYEERTVQDYGIIWDKITYFSDVLRKYINSRDTESGKLRAKRKFIVKRDQRDISKLYFLDPETKRYFDIPYRDVTGPTMSIWEYREVVTKLENENKENIDEEAIFQGIREMRAIVAKSKDATIKARKNHARKVKMSRETKIQTSEPPVDDSNKTTKSEKKIKPFADLSYESPD
jgi:putative transposase